MTTRYKTNLKTLGLTPLQRQVLGLLAARRQFRGTPLLSGISEKGWVTAADIQTGRKRYDAVLFALVAEGYCDHCDIPQGATAAKHAFRVNDRGLSWLALVARTVGQQPVSETRRKSLRKMRSDSKPA